MTAFTIETTYHLPVFRQRTYEAATLEDACQLAIDDDDWSDAKQDYDSSGEAYVSAAWDGPDCAYRGRALPVSARFADSVRRRADHFELMLGMLKILAHTDGLPAANSVTWLAQAQAVIAQAHAILAGAPDADAAAVPPFAYRVLEIPIARLREHVAAILETDPTLTSITADAVTDRELCEAGVSAIAVMDIIEQLGAAEFRGALAAIREADRRLLGAAEGGPDDASNH